MITECISMECFHTKTKVIMTANQKLGKYEMEPLRTQSKTGKLAIWNVKNTNDQLSLVLVLNLIGWESGTSFLDQSQSETKQNHSNPGLLLTVNLKLFSKQWPPSSNYQLPYSQDSLLLLVVWMFHHVENTTFRQLPVHNHTSSVQVPVLSHQCLYRS